MNESQQTNNGSVNREEHSVRKQQYSEDNTANNDKKNSKREDGEQINNVNTAQGPALNYHQVHHRSQVKTYTPPIVGSSGSGGSNSGIGTTPVVSIYTKPHLMKRLKQFLDHFDRAPQQMFIDFAFVEVEENDVSQFRYKLQHPILQSIYGPTVDEQLPIYQNESTSSSVRLPTSLTPRL